ncbi:hybrid sensor histidine kinase/response regulator [Palleronia abyssalis]|uniref:histidine kinase n=1 Tax=Palleronia abyssalis TaxID=1501240 RepID=A0A2R8BV30_9RHOB|nr:PAS-domain containing protein [Palleronia abyssalis]SPJ24018.1 Aerobic respiration control sensor protein ArcB [Palleronia abyssalis]
MSDAPGLIDPADPVEVQNAKLMRIAQSLMRKVEQAGSDPGLAYSQFERAALLEAQVRQRTVDLERTLALLHEANAAAEAARSNMAEAVESVQEGFALFDHSDHLVMSNSRFCREIADIVPRIEPGLPFADYVALVSQSIYLALPEGETRAQWMARRMARHADDSTVFNVRLTRDRWLQVGEHRTASGGTVILQTDVSEIMRAERVKRDRLLDEQAQMVRATLDHLNQGVCIFSARQRLVGWNDRMEDLLDRPIDGQVLGIRFTALVERLDEQIAFSSHFTREHLIAWANRTRPRRPISFEVNRGRDAILSVFAQEIPDRGFVISFTDVTAEREAERALRDMNETLERRVEERTEELGIALEEARRANASKTRFVAAASHDLLQPLSAAKLFVSHLEERAGSDAARATASKAVSALSSVEQIIEALLDISKLDSGQATMRVQEVELGRILHSLQSELGPAADAKGLRLKILDSTHIVRSDPVFLRRILQNLVSNAIRYTSAGRVLVGARRLGGTTRIEVRDTGPGIADEDRATIFQEFRQLGPSASGAQGLGLGLAIVERACGMLGHPLDLLSVPGRGSTFSVTVPRLSTLPQARPPRNDGLAPRTRGLVVLLVENDAEMSAALTLMIESWDNHVIPADSGEAAMDLLAEIDIIPDRLLIDYQLGDGMTGLDLIAVLRTRHGPIPAAVISASRHEDIAASCAAAGVSLIPKPLDRHRLIRLIDDPADAQA